MRSLVVCVLIGAPPSPPDAVEAAEVTPATEQTSAAPNRVESANTAWPASAGAPPAELDGAMNHRLWDPRRDPQWVGRDRRLSVGLYVFAAWLGVFGGALVISALAIPAGNADGTTTYLRLATLGGLAGVGAIGTVGLGIARYSHRRPLRSAQMGLTMSGVVIRF